MIRIASRYRDAKTNRVGRLRKIVDGLAVLRTERGGYIRVPVERLRLASRKGNPANLLKAGKRKYPVEISEAAARVGLRPKRYLEAMRLNTEVR